MLSPEDAAHMPEDTSGAIERLARPMKRREFIHAQRHSTLHQKHTDALPEVHSDTANGKNTPGRQVAQLREDNKRLRRDLNDLQAHFDKEIAIAHSSHQQSIEQYQSHLRDLMEEYKQTQEEHLELEQRYQQLYHSFQEAVEEEAQKMLTEAVHTVELTPEHTPPLLRDVRKTIELQARQVEDHHVAQALYLMREAQHKAQQMEQELDHERQQIAAERESLTARRNSIRVQAKLRFDAQKTRLQTQWAMAITTIVIVVVTVVLVLQIVLQSLFHPLAEPFPLFISVLVSGILAFIMARLWTHINYSHLKPKTADKASTAEKK